VERVLSQVASFTSDCTSGLSSPTGGIIPPRHSLIFIQVLNQVQELLLAFRLQDVHNEMAILHAQATAKA
jgi:hypothetical protein